MRRPDAPVRSTTCASTYSRRHTRSRPWSTGDPAVLLDVMGAPLTDLLALANATETPVEWSARNERA